MKCTYRLLPAANSDANEHFLFVAQNNRHAARRFFQAMDECLQKLARMPELGERQQFARDENADLRVWQIRGFENYLVFYRPVKDGIEVVRVLHAARDIAAAFNDFPD